MKKINLKDRLLKESSLLFISAMVANVSNFLFQLYMGRSLTKENLGILNSLLSFFVIMTVPTASLQIVVAKYVSKFKTKNEYPKIKYFLFKIVKKTSLFVVAIFVGYIALSGFIADFFQIKSIVPVVIVGILFALSFYLPIVQGALQGLQQFNYVGITMCGGSIVRLVSAVIFITIGLNVNGALGASIITNILVIAVSCYAMRYLLSYKEEAAFEGVKKDLFSYSLYAMIAMICYNLLTNIDLILVKHYFDPDTAGSFSAVVVLGKTILYLPVVISLVMFPMVSEAHTNETDVYALLNKGLTYTLAICILGFLGFLFFPKVILRLAYGGKYDNFAVMLQMYSFSMIFTALVNVVMNFNLARHSTKFIYSMVITTCLQILFIIFFHDTLKQVIFANMAASSAILIYNLSNMFLESRDTPAVS